MTPKATEVRVVITDVEIPFWSVCHLMLKWSFAAIPAAIILGLIWGVAALFLTALGGALHH